MDTLQIQYVNFRTREHLVKSLATLTNDLSDAAFGFRTLVLDNASGDDIGDLPARFPTLRIQTKISERNVGFGAGHNLLARGAKASYFLLLNPDTAIVEPATAARLLDSAERHNAAALGPRLVGVDGQTQMWDHGESYGPIFGFLYERGSSYWAARGRARAAAWVSGAALLVNKSAFEAVGGFDERFFLYKEEEDLCLRLRRRGGRVVYDPGIKVFHQLSVVARKSQHMQASLAYYRHKHRDWAWRRARARLLGRRSQ